MTGAFKGKGPLPRLQTSWDLRAACNFIGGGTGTGLLIATALLVLAGAPYATGLLLGLGFVAFGLFMVWLEIGRPWRSMNLFFHPETSWMTREGILAIPLFTLGALLLFYPPAAKGALVSSAIGVIAAGYLYCQARMLRAAKGIPSWASPALTPYILSTGLVEGTGLALCVPGLVNEGTMLGFALLLIVRALAWLRYQQQLVQTNAPTATLAVLKKLRGPLMLVGHLIPIVLLVLVSWQPNLKSLAIPAAGLLAAAMGWLSKAAIITRAAQTRGFAIPRTPIRGKGDSRLTNQGW